MVETGFLPNRVQQNLKNKIVILYSVLLAFNGAAWLWAVITFRDNTAMFGTAVLAYCFGLRHAVDADHLAAIDNVTRKLMHERKRPICVGLMFSLGHSTVVFIGSLGIATASFFLQTRFVEFRRIGEILGTATSAIFLFAIALANLSVLRSVYRSLVRSRNAEHRDEASDVELNGGIFARILRPLFSMTTRTWHMYPLGFLFGLGFDTATEIGLLGLTAAEASRGQRILVILLYPALFTVGMALIDTTDNLLMLGTYGWAFNNPMRKLSYNIAVTFASVVLSFTIGGLEALGLISKQFNLHGFPWMYIERMNDHLGIIGFSIVCFFMLIWIASVTSYRLKDSWR